MVKTAPLDEDTHTYLKKLQITLAEKYKRNITIADILAGMSKVLVDIDDTARKIIHVRARDHGQVIYYIHESDKVVSGEVSDNKSQHVGVGLVEKDE